MQNNRYYRKISAMVLTLMISASAAVAVNAAPATVSTDDYTTSGIVSSADDNDIPNDDED